MEISEKARPDGWNKVYEDVSCAPKRERGGSERERERERESYGDLELKRSEVHVGRFGGRGRLYGT